MTTLKTKIKTVDSLPNIEKKKTNPLKILIILGIILLITLVIYLTYNRLLPYINAVNINKIVGKKTNITECNTKDYIITLEIDGKQYDVLFKGGKIKKVKSMN